MGTIQGIAEDGKCEVCYEFYTDPRILQCGHTFCLECVKGVSRGCQSIISCPLCRGKTRVTIDGYNSLIKNLKAKKLAELGKTGPKQDECQKHRGRCLNLYCQNCRIAICEICKILQEHGTHKAILLKEYLSSKSEVFAEQRQRLNKKVAYLAESKSHQEACKLEYERQCERRLTSCQTSVEKMTASLDKHLAAVKEEMEENLKGVSSSYDYNVGMLKKEMLVTKAEIVDLESVLSDGTESQQLDLLKLIERQGCQRLPVLSLRSPEWIVPADVQWLDLALSYPWMRSTEDSVKVSRKWAEDFRKSLTESRKPVRDKKPVIASTEMQHMLMDDKLSRLLPDAESRFPGVQNVILTLD